ncbi:hypothetical protein [Actinoplanes sp. NPDC051851]|uniref:hypothetical protein n=1 Tax=Actinoplanes sp. NPDC051851 TaxID=3154753 RepID=UPI003435DC70
MELLIFPGFRGAPSNRGKLKIPEPDTIRALVITGRPHVQAKRHKGQPSEALQLRVQKTDSLQDIYLDLFTRSSVVSALSV